MKISGYDSITEYVWNLVRPFDLMDRTLNRPAFADNYDLFVDSWNMTSNLLMYEYQCAYGGIVMDVMASDNGSVLGTGTNDSEMVINCYNKSTKNQFLTITVFNCGNQNQSVEFEWRDSKYNIHKRDGYANRSHLPDGTSFWESRLHGYEHSMTAQAILINTVPEDDPYEKHETAIRYIHDEWNATSPNARWFSPYYIYGIPALNDNAAFEALTSNNPTVLSNLIDKYSFDPATAIIAAHNPDCLPHEQTEFALTFTKDTLPNLYEIMNRKRELILGLRT